MYNVYRVSSSVVKWAGRDVEHPSLSPSNAEVREGEGVELYFYSPAGLLG